jgi:hypothetical protein
MHCTIRKNNNSVGACGGLAGIANMPICRDYFPDFIGAMSVS